MGHTFSLVKVHGEEHVVVWGVEEITGVDPREELDYKVTATYYSNNEETELHFIFSYPGRRNICFNVKLSLRSTEIFNALLRGALLVFISKENVNMEKYIENYLAGGASLHLPSEIIGELNSHLDFFNIKNLHH